MSWIQAEWDAYYITDAKEKVQKIVSVLCYKYLTQANSSRCVNIVK